MWHPRFAFIGIDLEQNRDLMQIALARRLYRRFARTPQRGEEEADQNGDDANDDEELNQRKRGARARARCRPLDKSETRFADAFHRFPKSRSSARKKGRITRPVG